MTNAELIKALRYCISDNADDCDLCPYQIDCKSNGTGKDKMIRDAADAIERLQAQVPAWISVEERLPEESGEYTVYIQMGTGVEVPDFLGSNDLSYVTSVYFKKGQKLWLDGYDEAYNADLSLVDTANDYHVTHWMPLPQKPKGEHDEQADC